MALIEIEKSYTMAYNNFNQSIAPSIDQNNKILRFFIKWLLKDLTTTHKGSQSNTYDYKIKNGTASYHHAIYLLE